MKTFSQFISEVTLQKGETYGSSSYQKRLEDERQKKKDEKAAQNIEDTEKARQDLRSGFIRGSQDGKMGKFYKNPETGRYTDFEPD